MFVGNPPKSPLRCSVPSRSRLLAPCSLLSAVCYAPGSLAAACAFRVSRLGAFSFARSVCAERDRLSALTGCSVVRVVRILFGAAFRLACPLHFTVRGPHYMPSIVSSSLSLTDPPRAGTRACPFCYSPGLCLARACRVASRRGHGCAPAAGRGATQCGARRLPHVRPLFIQYANKEYSNFESPSLSLSSCPLQHSVTLCGHARSLRRLCPVRVRVTVCRVVVGVIRPPL